MKIAIILGSIREGRRTYLAANYLQEAFSKKADVEVRLLDLADFKLPLLQDRWKKQSDPDAALVAFATELKEADALVLCSPEYHGSFTGVLKNAIDHYWTEFRRKPMGVVATGSGPMGGINASTEMQLLILSLGAFPMPVKLLFPNINDAFDEEGRPVREDIVNNTEQFVDEFLWFANAIQSAKVRT